MVENTRKTYGIDENIALNVPILINVIESKNKFPKEIQIKNKFIKVLSVIDLWHVYGEWWKENSVNRMYYRINSDDRVIILFKNIDSNLWYLQNDY
jgi:hypothetical protein